MIGHPWNVPKRPKHGESTSPQPAFCSFPADGEPAVGDEGLGDIGRQIERLALDHDASLAGPWTGYFSFGPDCLQFAVLQLLTSFANRPPVTLQVPMGHLPAFPPNICIPRPEYWAEAVSTKLNTRTNAATVISVKILNIMPSLEYAKAAYQRIISAQRTLTSRPR
jgi:hypothetical protein